ncbi:MAG TPA: porin, partial [Elusimicrobiales bacterium]|nr:porin [Elusimicrobiales bacterium]
MKRKLTRLLAVFALVGFVTSNVFAVQTAKIGNLDLSVWGRLDAFTTIADIDESPNNDGETDDYNKVDNFVNGFTRVSLNSAFTEDLQGGVEIKTTLLSMEGGLFYIDEFFGMLQSEKFGRLEMGYTEDVTVKMNKSSVDVGSTGINTQYSFWFLMPFILQDVQVAAGDIYLMATTTQLDTSLWTNRISYLSPKTYGFQFGVAYIPSAVYPML